MDNTNLYLEHYSKNLNRDLLLFPVKGICINMSNYLVTFNDIIDTSSLKTILEYYAYEQFSAFKIDDMKTFEKIRKRMDVVIDSMWSKGKTRPSTIFNSINGMSSIGQIHVEENTTDLTKKSNIYMPESFNTTKYNISYGAKTTLYEADRKYSSKMDVLVKHEYSKKQFIDMMYSFNAYRINEIKSSAIHHSLFKTEKLSNTVLFNSLQNSIITKDFNPIALRVFRRSTVRRANLLQGLFITKNNDNIKYINLSKLNCGNIVNTKYINLSKLSFGNITRELTIINTNYMFRSLNTEILLFATLDGKLTRKECILASALMETAQLIVHNQICLNYTNYTYTANLKSIGNEFINKQLLFNTKSLSKQGSKIEDSLWTYINTKYGTIHGTYTAMDDCLKECDSVYKFITGVHGNKFGISESFNFTWCSINAKSSIIHDHHVLTTTTSKPGEIRRTEFLTTKQRLEMFNLQTSTPLGSKPDSSIVLNDTLSSETKDDANIFITEDISTTKEDSNLLVQESIKHPIKNDKAIVVPNTNTNLSKTDKDILFEASKRETNKTDKEITIADRRGMTTKQLKDLFLQEQATKVVKNDSDIIVVDNVSDLEKIDRNITIHSMSYVIEKNPADIAMGDIYMLLKGNSNIYIPLNTTIPMEQAYKTITLLNDIISVDKNFSNIHLADMELLSKAKPDIIILDQNLNGSPFDKREKNVILNSSVDVPYIKDDKDILLEDNLIPANIIKRWYFLPDIGPYDRLVLPLDYPYNEHPIKGVVTGDSDGSSYPFTAKDNRIVTNTHPMINGSNQATEEIDVSIAIMANIIDYGYMLKDTYKHVYDRYTPSQAIKHFVNLYYNWLNDYVPNTSYHVPGYVMTNKSNNPETYRADYWRLYRWIRWHAEAIIQNLSDSELNVLDGNSHIQLLLDQLIRYFNDHHGIYAKDGKYTLDKVKGVRHVWLSRYNKF